MFRPGVNAIQEALSKHKQEKAMLEKRIAGDQQRLHELDAIIGALEAIPAEAQETQTPQSTTQN